MFWTCLFLLYLVWNEWILCLGDFVSLVDWWPERSMSCKKLTLSPAAPWHDSCYLELLLWAWASMEAGLVLHLQDTKHKIQTETSTSIFCFLRFPFNLAPYLAFYFRYPCNTWVLLYKIIRFGEGEGVFSQFGKKEIICSFIKNILFEVILSVH